MLRIFLKEERKRKKGREGGKELRRKAMDKDAAFNSCDKRSEKKQR
jgi:hypothetical protein